MQLIKQFEQFLINEGTPQNAYRIQKFNDVDSIELMCQHASGTEYNVCLLFHTNKNEDVEIHVRKQIQITNPLETLQLINNLNANSFGISFFIVDDILVLKLPVSSKGNLNEILNSLNDALNAAEKAFPQF